MNGEGNAMATERRSGQKLVRLADNDEWDKCLFILLQRQRLSQQEENEQEPLVWLRGKTKDGDCLVHLASYASCETAMPLDSRKMALECLELILEADPSAVHRIAGDGGMALHAAIAAASASTMQAGDSDDDITDQDSGRESDDSEFDVDSEFCDEEESDSDCEYDEKEYPSRTAVAEDSRYADFSTDQISTKAIDLLMKYGADPNLPMRNDIDSSEMEEMEFIYSRETILEQWTPFSLALIWVALASMKLQLTSLDDLQSSTTMMLPLVTVKSMLLNGADPSCPMGANAPSNAIELITSCAHCLNVRVCCDTLMANGINVISDEPSMSVAACLQHILLNYTTTLMPELTAEQAFCGALIANDVETASTILSHSQDRCVMEKWRSSRWSDLLPMPQATWCASSSRESWTLLSACVATRAIASLNFLLVGSSPLDEQYAIQAFEVAFSNEGMARAVMSNLYQLDLDDGDGTRELQREICAALVNAVYPPSLTDAKSMEARQMFLDRLLLRASSAKWGNYHAITILLVLGADPDTTSVASLVQNNFRPLHFVAANRGGTGGVAMAEALIHAGANVDISDAQGQTPLKMALRHANSRLVECIWKSRRNLSTGPSGDDAFSFGKAAVACQSLPMLRQAVASLRDSADEVGTKAAKESLGQLLLSCVDERSGFSSRQDVDGSYPLVAAVAILLGRNDSSVTGSSVSNTKGKELLPTFAADEISKYTVLHSILRTDRDKELRLATLGPFCELAAKNDSREDEVVVSLLNLSCDSKFGSYTALHLACALGCEESIQTLLSYGANITALDYQGCRPCELAPKLEDLSRSTRRQLGLDP
jgi:ankyrin repeat protein